MGLWLEPKPILFGTTGILSGFAYPALFWSTKVAKPPILLNLADAAACDKSVAAEVNDVILPPGAGCLVLGGRNRPLRPLRQAMIFLRIMAHLPERPSESVCGRFQMAFCL